MQNRPLCRTLCLVLAILTLSVLAPSAAGAVVLPGYTSQVDYDNTDRQRYIIDIDLTNQLIFVRERESGKIVLQSICSTGMTGFATFSGTFPMGHLKERAGYFIEFKSYALYWSQIARCVYIHSILFSSPEGTHRTMSRKTYNELNTRASHGCVRVLPDVAKWIFYNCPPGTECKIGGRKRLADLQKRLKFEQPVYETYYVPRDGKPFPQQLTATLKRAASLGTGVTGNTKFVCNVLKNETVTMLQISPTWCKVQRTTGEMGYILRRNLEIHLDKNALTPASEMQKAPAETTLFLAVPKTGPNAKKLAGTRDTLASFAVLYGEAGPVQPKRDVILRRLTNKSVLEVLSDEGKYFLVRYGHIRGYVLKSHVEIYQDMTR